MRKFLTLLHIILTTSLTYTQVLITDYGARSGETCTESIQAAIDATYEQGGGTVMVPAGRYLTGTLELKSNINLHLDAGAVLEGSTDLNHYKQTFRTHGMIYSNHAINVSITGQGTIDGKGDAFYDFTQSHTYPEFDRHLVRQRQAYQPEGTFHSDGPVKRTKAPGMTLTFYHCSNVKIQHITIKDTPVWAVRLAYCEDVLVQGVTIRNNLMVPNSDGIHCTTSRNIRISDCNISAGDDAIIFTGFRIEENVPGISDTEYKDKTYGNKSGYCENFSVSNCQLQSRSAGIRIGYGQQPIRNGVFSNIIIYESNRGIGIFAHDASDIEDLIFSNIVIKTRLHNGQWWGHGEPIHLSSESRFPDQSVGVIRNIYFNHIQAESEHGILIYGHENSPMENISLDHITLKVVAGKETLTYGGNFDLRPAAKLNRQIFQHDIPGIFAKDVDGLDIEHFDLIWGENLPDFFTYGIETEKVRDLFIRDFFGAAHGKLASENPLKLVQTTIRN
jgi:polygalacturonase